MEPLPGLCCRCLRPGGCRGLDTAGTRRCSDQQHQVVALQRLHAELQVVRDVCMSIEADEHETSADQRRFVVELRGQTAACGSGAQRGPERRLNNAASPTSLGPQIQSGPVWTRDLLRATAESCSRSSCLVHPSSMCLCSSHPVTHSRYWDRQTHFSCILFQILYLY